MALNPYDTPRGKLRTRAEATRRQFLGIMGGVGAMGALVFGGVMSLKFMFPSATNEEPTQFKTSGFDPIGLQPGQVQQITEKRVSLVRDSKGFYAVYLVCTHLGCTPNFTTDVLGGSGKSATGGDVTPHYGNGTQPGSGWACPCHGSRYYINSTNFYGPAPRPMDWVKVSWALDKKSLLIDRGAIVVKRGAGDQTVPEWRLDPTPGGLDNGKTLGAS